MLEVLYLDKFTCVCGASYLVGMKEGSGPRCLIGLYDWPVVPATPTDAGALEDCGTCGRDLLRGYLDVTPVGEIEVDVVATESCDPCDGTGLVSCQHCNGEGENPDGSRCGYCDGKTGLVSCETCAGEGDVPTDDAVTAVMEVAMQGRRAFWDSGLPGGKVLPAEAWDTLGELARLTAGRSSGTE